MADQDLDRDEAAGTSEDDAPARSQDARPRLFGHQPPFGTRGALGPDEAAPHPELPDAFAPGVALGGTGDGPGGAGPEPGGADDPYGPPDDYDTADAYDTGGPYSTADPYGTASAYGAVGGYDAGDPDLPGGYGHLGTSARADDDYDAGDEYRPPGSPGATGPDSPLSLILNSGGPPGQFGAPAPPAPDAWPDAFGVPAEPAAQPVPPPPPPGPEPPGPQPLSQPGPEPEPGPPRQPRPAPQPGPEPRPVPQPRPGPRPQPGPLPPPSPPRTVSADSLTADLLLPGRHKAPSSGWRRAIFEVTGGLVRAPESAAERRRRELAARAGTPVTGGHHRVAVLSLKGGVGKTTTTVGLGSTLASLRGDRVIAVDANPDRGTLSDKLRLETAATVRDLLNERDQIHRYADVRSYTTQAPSRLEVLASDRDPTVSVAFGEQDYCDVSRVLEHYYSICLTDCGTGLLHSAMTGVLRLADQIAVVSSPSVDGARSASATLDWLQAHGYGDLVRRAVVVLAVIRPRGKSAVDIDRLEQHFADRCRAVVRVPYDAYLDEGAEVELGRLHRATADAYLRLAAEIGDGFARPPKAAR